MGKLVCCVITIASFLCLSCEYNDISPDVGFIKAKFNGTDAVYRTPPEDRDYYNYIRPGSINIRFNEDNSSSQYWSIDIIYGNTTLDINNLPLPFTISGPSRDVSGVSPEAHMLIVDPDGGPYGKQIAAASSFEHEFTLTITSVQNNVIKGTFEGVGYGEFVNGEFSAALAVKDW